MGRLQEIFHGTGASIRIRSHNVFAQENQSQVKHHLKSILTLVFVVKKPHIFQLTINAQSAIIYTWKQKTHHEKSE